MLTVCEIEAAIDALPRPEQELILSHLIVRFEPDYTPRSADHDPFLELIEQLERNTLPGEATNIAANYKEFLYGHPSNE